MPQLDVSFMTADPMLADVFNVRRRVDVVGTNGRTTPTDAEAFVAQVGVVTQQDPAAFMRREDGQIVPRRIFLASRFAFRNISRSPDGLTQYQPDQITWPVGPAGELLPDSTVYTIEEVFPYSRYGAGMHEAVAASQIAVDVPQ